MIEESVLERVLSSAMRGGGEFAEVFAEDKRSSSAVLDDGKVEEVTSGRDRGAGIRVVGRRDHRLRPHRRPLRGRPAGRGRGGGGGRPRRRRRAPRSWP